MLSYFRYEEPIEKPKDEPVSDDDIEPPKKTVSFEDFKQMTVKDLKRMTVQMLRCRSMPAYARVLMDNVIKHYNQKKDVPCKIIRMIDSNTLDWTDYDKLQFVHWYYQKLRKIASKR